MPRGNPGRTKKPCPACGVVPEWSRPAGLCEDCQRLIKDGKELQEQMTAKKGEAAFSMPSEPWHMHYYEGDIEREIRDQLSAAVHTLVFKIARSTVSRDSIREYGQVPDKHVFESEKIEHSGRVVVLHKQVQEALNVLDVTIRLAVESSYENGKKEGVDLLHGLMNGTITNAEINKRVEKSHG